MICVCVCVCVCVNYLCVIRVPAGCNDDLRRCDGISQLPHQLTGHRRANWPVYLRAAQVRRMTAGCREGCMPTAPSRIGKSKEVMFRARNWLLRIFGGNWSGHTAAWSVLLCPPHSSTRGSKDRWTGVVGISEPWVDCVQVGGALERLLKLSTFSKFSKFIYRKEGGGECTKVHRKGKERKNRSILGEWKVLFYQGWN